MDITNLKNFASGDAIYLISFIGACFIITYWKKGDFVKIAGVLVVYAIVAVMLKGQAMLSFLGGFLKWFGIDSGL